MRDVAMDSLIIMGVPVTPYLAGAYNIRTTSDNERTLVVLDNKDDAVGLAEALEESQRRVAGHDMPKYVPYRINGQLRYGQFEFQTENGEHRIVIVR